MSDRNLFFDEILFCGSLELLISTSFTFSTTLYFESYLLAILIFLFLSETQLLKLDLTCKDESKENIRSEIVITNFLWLYRLKEKLHFYWDFLYFIIYFQFPEADISWKFLFQNACSF